MNSLAQTTDSTPLALARLTRRHALAVAATLLAACLTPPPPAAAAPGEETHVYAQPGDRPLELHVFQAAPAAGGGGGPAPAVVLFGGGGWIETNPRHFFGQAKEIAAAGVTAIAADYRTQKADGTDPQASLADAATAIAWVRAHADELGIDPERIGAGGGSAGGQLAAACALTPDDKLPANLPASCRPGLLMLLNPVLDNGPEGYGHDRLGEDHAWFSPIHNLGMGRPLPPTLILTGDADRIVPPATLERFVEKARATGAEVEMILYPGEGHSFFNRGTRGPGKYRETLDEMLRFLEEQGWAGAPAEPN